MNKKGEQFHILCENEEDAQSFPNRNASIVFLYLYSNKRKKIRFLEKFSVYMLSTQKDATQSP
jgi:hypothetical protein